MRIEIDTLLHPSPLPPADKVAIKVVDLDRAGLDAKALRMLSSEIATLECVHHPNILRYVYYIVWYAMVWRQQQLIELN